MRRELRILGWTLALGGMWTGGSRVLEALPSMEAFRVTAVDVTGLKYVARDDVVGMLGLTPETSVWGDTDAWARRLEEHPMLEEVRVERRMPGTLVIHVTERRPVALVPTPTLEPVDAEGRRLPVDPAMHRLDLPVLLIDEAPARATRLLPSRARALAAEVGRLQEADTTFLQMVSEVAWRGPHTVVARWSDPEVDFLLEPGASARRVREGLAALKDALGREPSRTPKEIDLRYADQVVVRRTR